MTKAFYACLSSTLVAVVIGYQMLITTIASSFLLDLYEKHTVHFPEV